MANKKAKVFYDYFIILVGAFLVGISITMFFSPYELVIGGVTGFAIILEDLSSRAGFTIPIWLTNLVLNVPLFVIGLKVFGVKNIIKTIFATLALTFFIFICDYLPVYEFSDTILVAIFGGALDGLGLGLIFRCNATTGGTDMMASLIHVKVRHISIAKIMFIIDSVVIALGLLVFGPEKTLYAIIAVFIAVKVIDAVQEGMSFAKAVFIISESYEEISASIIKDLDRGITSLNGKGMFTKDEKNVLMCVVSNKEIVLLKDIVHSIDGNAFVIVADVREVLGEGFKSVT